MSLDERSGLVAREGGTNAERVVSETPATSTPLVPDAGGGALKEMVVASPFISASEIAPYLEGVMQIKCGDSLGSASLWKLTERGTPEYVALTSAHVTSPREPRCMLLTGSENERGQIVLVEHTAARSWNVISDTLLLPVKRVINMPEEEEVEKETLNYNVSSLSSCPEKMPVGSPVVAIGFPSFGLQEVYESDGYYTIAAHQIVSSGIVSGFTRYADDTSLPYDNYFISAKIDTGNSGGIVLSKAGDALCILGVPTWVSVGTFETQGLVQNIHNILFQE